MAELINLRRARKRKARADREVEAQANRERHGTSSLDRKLEHARREKTLRDHNAHKLDEDSK